MSLVERVDMPESPAVASTPSPVADPLAIVARLAENPAVDPDKLVKLYELAERSRMARAREAFNAAMAAAKGEIGPIVKNKTVDFTSQKGRTNYRYEDFAEVARVVDRVIVRHGLTYRHRATQEHNRIRVTCIVSHADGYSEETTLEAGEDQSGNKNGHQAIGSAATYLQRYTLKLALGLAATADDDASGLGEVERIDADQAAYVEQLLRDTGSDSAKFLQWIASAAISELTPTQFKKAVAFLGRKKRNLSL